MRKRARARTRLLAACLAASLWASWGCDTSDAAPTPEPGIYPESRLRIEGEPTGVLVAIDGEAAIHVRDFNDRLMEFAVEDRGQQVEVARRQVLDKMIDYQLIVWEGRRRHPEMAGPAPPEKGRYYTQRLLAQTVIGESVTNPDLVSDAEAREYLASHREALENLIQNTPSEEDQLVLAKVSLIDARWREQLRTWRTEREVRIFEEHLRETVDS